MANLPKTFKAIQIHENGGNEVLRLNDVELPPVGDKIVVKVSGPNVGARLPLASLTAHIDRVGWCELH